MVSQASNDGTETVSATIDMQQVDSVRRIWPFLRDRRIDAYDNMNQRYLDTYLDESKDK